MAVFGWQELIMILTISSLLIVPILLIYFLIKHAVEEGIREALGERVPTLQATTRICPQCERGVPEEAKFCSNCGKKLKTS